jgi:Na+-driven multidrug efflux pump
MASGTTEDEDKDHFTKEEKESSFTIAKEIIAFSLPSMLAMFASTSQFMLDVYFVGLLKNVAMTSGVGLGSMIVNLFGV